jgi:hypothetical protein
MRRVAGWEQTLHRFNMACLRRPFAWGEFDCALYAADAINAMTGVDFAADFRGRYDSEESAWRFLASLGYRDLGELASSRLPEILTPDGKPAPSLARRGDVGLFNGEQGQFLAICDGRTFVGPTLRGLQHAPLTACLRAWRVG